MGHLFGFQVVCSAGLRVCLEGETLLGAQPVDAGAATALCLEPAVLQDAGSLWSLGKEQRGVVFFFHPYYFKWFGFALSIRRGAKLGRLPVLSGAFSGKPWPVFCSGPGSSGSSQCFSPACPPPPGPSGSPAYFPQPF